GGDSARVPARPRRRRGRRRRVRLNRHRIFGDGGRGRDSISTRQLEDRAVVARPNLSYTAGLRPSTFGGSMSSPRSFVALAFAVITSSSLAASPALAQGPGPGGPP